MAFDISKLTDAVNRHLNSISDISAMVKQASEEVDAKTRFSAELSEAIRQNIQDHMATEEFQALQSLQEVSKSFSAANDSDSAAASARELNMKELQDLSKSKYFSVNLVQNALYNTDNGEDDSNGESTDLTKALLPGSDSTTALSGEDTNAVISELLGESGLTSASGNDYTKALLSAYTKLQNSESAGSVFGSFLL